MHSAHCGWIHEAMSHEPCASTLNTLPDIDDNKDPQIFFSYDYARRLVTITYVRCGVRNAMDIFINERD